MRENVVIAIGIVAAIVLIISLKKILSKPKESETALHEDEDWQRVSNRLFNHERGILDFNKKIIQNITYSSPTAMHDFEQLTKGFVVVGKIEIAKSPDGRFQKERCNATFHKVYVQYLRADKENKVFFGYIYAIYNNANNWLKIPFES